LKGRFKRVWGRDEFRFYLFLVLAISVIVFVLVYLQGSGNLEQSFRNSLFQVVSIITTTGYVVADYTTWGPGVLMIFFLLLFSGASAGSTSGGIKLIRTLTFIKNADLEFKRLLHPNAIIKVRLNEQVVSGRVLTHIYTFLLVYFGMFLFGTLVLSFMGIDFITAAGASISSISNVGPAIGEVGPMDNFAWLPSSAKVFLSFLMIMGRLELFTILILFTPYFWKAN